MVSLPTCHAVARACRAWPLVVSLLAGAALPGRGAAQQPGAADHAVALAAAARGDWNAAAGAMERAVHASPGSAEYHYWLGRAYSGQARQASLWRRTRLARRIIDAWERALALDSTHDATYEELIPLYAQLPGVAGGDDRRAEALLARWLRIHPYAAGLARVRFDLARGFPARAVEDAGSLVRAFPDSARPLAELAIAHQRASRFADAWAAIDRGLARWPAEPRLLFALGRAAAETGERLEAGERALRRVASAGSGVDQQLRANARYRLGVILARRGDRAGARAEYEAALALAPTLRDAREALERVR
jgi:tetratricopeptide (TPR) repeat protein